VSSDRSAAVKDACERARAAMLRGEVVAALRHYEYARRLTPADAAIILAIGKARLAQREPRAIEAFGLIAAHHDVQEAWLGLASAHRWMNEQELAANNLRISLSRHAYVGGAANVQMYDVIGQQDGAPGWCAMSADGRLRVTLFDPAFDMNRVVILVDGSPLGVRPSRCGREGNRQRATYLLPNSWRHATEIGVCLKARPLFGSPLHAAVISQVEGFVGAREGALVGWAWHPHDPERAPQLTVRDAVGTTLRITASEPVACGEHPHPFAKPRGLFVPSARLRTMRPPIAVQDAGGANLYGSPLDPLADERSAAGAAELARRMFPASTRRTEGAVDLCLPAVPADIMGVCTAPKRVVRAAGVDVVIPVFRDRERTLACIRSVLASLPASARCIVVEDASPEAKLVGALQDLAARGQIVLLRQPKNRGFPATANAGIRAAANRDVILLNSDTLVPPKWIERLTEAAYSASDIGTATPFSNDATIFSYPSVDDDNAVPDEAAAVRLDRLARRANGSAVVDVPTAHGFCVYLRRDCISSVGLLREDLFAQGYGEENDFCIRARHLGWRHVAVPGVFVAHSGGASFGGAKSQLKARNVAILNRLHPGYDLLIAGFREAEPLAEARFRIDVLRWRNQRSRKRSVILITHSRAGGVKRHVAERCQAVAASGLRPIVLTPWSDALGKVCCSVSDASDESYPNLRFDTSAGLSGLAEFLREDRPAWVEFHHFIGHDPALFGLAPEIAVPYDVTIHDYAWICPRITLVGADKRYCGEPGDHDCEACYADLGGKIEEDIRPAHLRLRSQGVLAGARRVIVPSHDVAERIQRYCPGLVCTVTPWEQETILPRQANRRVSQLRRRVVIVGAIGIEKGYEYLLACARYVAAQRLALEFVLVGYSCDDKRLLDTGVVHITGAYDEAEAIELIRAQQAELGFLPSVWPETWSYTLSQMWQAGLDVVAFDLGTPAGRIRETRRGSLLPLGLPPAAACRALLAYRNDAVVHEVGEQQVSAA
jgi:GT2 family glycosyltransferase